MDAPSVTFESGLLYKVSFMQPNSGGIGIALEAYEIVFKRKDGQYASLLACDGSQ